MKNNTEILKTKDMTSRSKAILYATMRTAKTKEDFKKALRSKGMGVVFRTNEQVRIYGVTFIDHENRIVLNGSRLGKEFSANVFQGLFNEGKTLQQMVPAMKNAPVQVTNSAHQDISAKSIDTSVFEEGLGIFDIKPQGENYEENVFAQKMRKRRRRKRV